MNYACLEFVHVFKLLKYFSSTEKLHNKNGIHTHDA